MRSHDRIVECLTVASTTPAVTEDSSPVGNGKVDSTYRTTGVTPSISTKELAGHQADLPRHTHVRVSIVGSGPYRACTVRAVTVVIHRVTIDIDRIHPIHVIDVAIVIIIHAISGNFTGIDPHLANEFLVSVSDSGVDHRHDHILGTGCGIPCFHCSNINSFGTAILARVLQSPQPPLRQALVTGHNGATNQEIRFNCL